ncbi:polysaccharide deacetylase [Tumebacillus sp. ITR2]|uniref:Polysaccharide deacetylase n=1 Tax=Tumebacillus amylolyticus TaxID=2801339 RepID=A0ABS1J6I8_9BACL|nr:polysaccharide deacetylase family protein [Tumebacillus amylolyticus]MBL0385684.1 polysaccharide deacetylase [Tumebacillus amylolyticus]
MKPYIVLAAAVALVLTGVLTEQALPHTEKVSSQNTAQSKAPVQREVQKVSDLPEADPKPQHVISSVPPAPPTPQPIPGKVAYLTFDDGPSENTARILDTLNNEHIHGTFFVIGNSTPNGQDLLRRIVNDGNAIGNHTYSHNYTKIYKSLPAFLEDFNRNEAQIEQATGIHTTLMRFPGGTNNTVSIQAGGKGIMHKIAGEMTKEGYVYFDWNVSSGDASGNNIPAATLIDNVLTQSKGKDTVVILLHDALAKSTTCDALPAIIQGLRQQGFSFDKLNAQSPAYQFRS